MVFAKYKALNLQNYPGAIARTRNKMLTEEEEEGLDTLAAEQIEKEREGPGLLWQGLEMLTRPGYAVSGVAKDLVDGTGFHPYDRVSGALAGKEKYGYKEFLDAVSPGRWTTATLPDFLGGKEIDPAKEGIGLFLDMLLDPLAYTKIGTMLSHIGGKRLVRTTKHEAAIGARIATVGKARKSLRAGIKEAEDAAAAKISEVGHVAGPYSKAIDFKVGAARTRAKIKKFYNIFDDYQKNPHLYKNDPVVAEMMAQYEGKVMADPTLAGRFMNDQNTLLGIRLPGTKVTIRALPFLDKRFGQALAQLQEASMRGMRKSKVLSKMVDFWSNTFIYSTGNAILDDFVAKSLNKVGFLSETYKDVSTRFTNIFPKNASDEFIEQAIEYMERPHVMFGREFREIPVEFQAIVKEGNKILKDIDALEKSAGIWRKTLSGQKLKSVEESFGIMTRMMEKHHKDRILNMTTKEAFDLGDYVKYGNIRSWDDFNRHVDRILKGQLERKEFKFGKGMIKKQRMKIASEEARKLFKEAEDVLGTSIPDLVTGYWPRYWTPEAKTLFAHVLNRPEVTYGEKQAHQFFTDRTMGRKFEELSVKDLNELYDKDLLPYDFLNEILGQWKDLAAKDRGMSKKYFKFLEGSDVRSMKWYITNPGIALQNRITDAIEAVTNKEFVDGITEVFGETFTFRKAASDAVESDLGKVGEAYVNLGQRAALLSPTAMRVQRGSNWRLGFTDEQLEIYDKIVEEARLRDSVGLREYFLSVDRSVFSEAVRAELPIFKMNADIMDEVNKVVYHRTSPESNNLFIKSWREITQWFRSTTLAFFPGYHARNVFGQFWMAHMGGTMHLQNYVDAWNFMKNAQLMPSMRRAKEGGGLWSKVARLKDAKSGEILKPLQDMRIPIEGGGFIGGFELARIFNENGVMQHGMLQQEVLMKLAKRFGEPKGQTLQKTRKVLAGVGKEFTHYGKVINNSFEAGNFIETWQRMAHVIGELRKGKTVSESMQSLRKYFYKFSELTDIERNYFRELIPFYGWARKNIPAQVRGILEQPNKYANLNRVANFLQSDEAKQMDRALLPKWVNENFGVPTRINKETGDVEVMILRSWIPSMDLMALATDNPVASLARTAASMSHPVLKFGAEHMFNESLFTERPIEEFPNEPTRFLGGVMNKTTANILRSFRVLNEINKAVSHRTPTGEISGWQAFLNATAVTPKIKGFDVKALGERLNFDINQRAGTLNRLYNKMKRTGQTDMVEFYQGLMEDAKSTRNPFKKVSR